MTIHFNYDYECKNCTKLFIPFEDVCPNCGALAPKDDSIIEAFVKSAKYNKEAEYLSAPIKRLAKLVKERL